VLEDDDAAAALERVRAVERATGPARRADARRVARADAHLRLGEDQRDPSHARLAVDCRVPPGLGETEALARIEEIVGRDGYRLEWTEQVIGNRSPFDSPLADFIRGWVAGQDPSAICVPTVILPGFTDSRTFRAPSRSAPPTASSRTASRRASRPTPWSTARMSGSTCATSSSRRPSSAISPAGCSADALTLARRMRERE
jgi:hypothetical protein